MNHSTPGLPVHHQLPEFTQTHAHQVGDAIQPSHPLSSPPPPAPNPSQMNNLDNTKSIETEVKHPFYTHTYTQEQVQYIYRYTTDILYRYTGDIQQIQIYNK